jgi:8-oxo-dGTP pyrophosphatase MutT (NUDIX family)
MADITRLSSRIVYENPWLRVREDDVRFRDGHESIFGVVEKRDFAVVIARDETGVWLVQQYRYAVGGRYWEFPQGSAVAGATVSGEALARAELAEETGLRAERMQHLGRLFAGYGLSDHSFDVWLATRLTAGAPDRERSEQDMVARHVSFAEWDAMVDDGRVRDSHSVAAWALLLRATGG